MLRYWRSFGVGRRWVVLSLVLAIMLFAGLRPQGFTFRNTASLLDPSPGLTFGAHGLAFTRPFVFGEDATRVARDGLTLDLEVEVAKEPPNGFAAVAVLHNGNHDTQWYLGQWQQSFVLMNGDDYNHERRLPRVSANTAKMPPGRLHLQIASDAKGSTFFVNGERIDHRPDFIQTVPVHGRLTLGNAPDGKHPWNGTLHRFALYQKSLEPGESEDGVQPLAQTGPREADISAAPWLLYRFEPNPGDEDSARQVADQSGNAIDLDFPRGTAFLTREFLGPGTVAPFTGEITSQDGLLNFFGFIPFGWLVAGLIGSRRISPNPFLLIATTTGTGFALSLGMEFLQTWIPTRSSSLLDLILNTGGTMAGAILASGLASRSGPRRSSPAPSP